MDSPDSQIKYLTKREYVATLCMASMNVHYLTPGELESFLAGYAKQAVAAEDALIAALNEEESNE